MELGPEQAALLAPMARAAQRSARDLATQFALGSPPRHHWQDRAADLERLVKELDAASVEVQLAEQPTSCPTCGVSYDDHLEPTGSRWAACAVVRLRN